jgi:hypothetical protein
MTTMSDAEDILAKAMLTSNAEEMAATAVQGLYSALVMGAGAAKLIGVSRRDWMRMCREAWRGNA